MKTFIDAERRYHPDVKHQHAMVDYLAARIVDDATGVSDGDLCAGEPPRARYYLSTLAPVSPVLPLQEPTTDRDANTSLGFETEVQPATVLHIEAGCSVYFRRIPTFAEQRSAWNPAAGGVPARGAKARGVVPRVPVLSVYERIEIAPISVDVPVGTEPMNVGDEEFAKAFAEARNRAVTHPRAFRSGFRHVPIDALSDEATYERFVATQTGAIVDPAWAAHVAVIPRSGRDGRRRVNVLLVNDSVQPILPPTKADAEPKRDDDRDHFLFRASLRAKAVSGSIRAIGLDLGPDAYRYEGKLAAYALSCGVQSPGWDGRTDAVPELVAVPAPRELTFRIEPLQDVVVARATRYDLLAEDPLPLLREFEAHLRRYAEDPEVWSRPGLDDQQGRSLDEDHRRALAEAARFAEGVRWLNRDARLLLAFRLANSTMLQLARITGKSNSAWRSFQLVAIVSELTTLAWREHPATAFARGIWGTESGDPTQAATVVFFPTAGGKTEATVIGMTACAIFYDRLRGKGRGVTSICRYPLKVLTLNQCQRLVEFVVAAEHVRQEKAAEIASFEGAADVPFELGLLIGSDDTPNRLSQGEWMSTLQNAEALDRTRVVDRCPFCFERSVRLVPPTSPELRLDHRCDNCHRRLPILITDGEVYRYLPSLVVGTLDKLAMIGLSDRFSMLLGDADCECTVHGLSRGGKCVEAHYGIKDPGDIVPIAPLVDASPTFEFLDELHLNTEELGAFDAHYETALAEIQRLLTAGTRADRRGVRAKVVATTATIKGEDRQIDHLFGLSSVVTPTMGPLLDETFYWRREFESPMRLFLGIQPNHGKTAEMTVVRLLSVLHAAIQDLKRRGRDVDPAFADVPVADFPALVELYRRTLTYTTSLVDLGKLHRSIPTQVDAYLLDHGYDRINFEMLYSGSSREGIGAVRRIVEDLEKDDGTTDAVIATSSVSHGLDIDRLNIMIFNGQPKQTAEYIQASSRVGRRVEGLVVVIYNPRRERDRSTYRLHGKYHQYLDRQVAPVAINRWSRFAGYRTFPGIFMAYVLQALNRDWWRLGKAPKHLHQLEQMQLALDNDNMTGANNDAIKRAMVVFYQADRPEALELKAWIEATVDDVVARLRMAAPAMGGVRGGRGIGDYRATSDFLEMGYKPMISLRDVDTGIAFWPNRGRS